MTLYYAIALVVAFYLLLIAEFLLPSGGVIGAAAAAALIAAILIAFSHSMTAGITLVFFVLVTTPVFVFGLLRAWPQTPIGRRMLNRRPGQLADDPPKKVTAQGTPIDELVGRIGTAKTDLLPSGLVMIDGEKVDAVSTGMPIDAGATIIVTSVELGRVHVRAASDDELSGAEKPPQSPPSLEESLDSFEVE